jgi:hypothetical protein
LKHLSENHLETDFIFISKLKHINSQQLKHLSENHSEADFIFTSKLKHINSLGIKLGRTSRECCWM